MRLKLDNIALLLIIVASISRLLIPQINTVMLFGVIPALYIWRTCNDTIMFGNRSVLVYTLLLFWNFVATVFADNPNQALDSLTSAILGAYLLSIIFYSISRKSQSHACWIMIAYWFILASSLFYLSSIGLIDSIDITTDRLNDDKVNANDLAYYTFYVICTIPLLFGIKNGNRKKPFLMYVLLVFMIYQTVQLALLTASRQFLLLVLPFAIFTLVFCASKGKLSKIAIGSIVILVVFCAFAESYVLDKLDGSYLMARMETNIKDDSRTPLLIRAIEVGADNLLLGVGPGNFVNYTDGHFSHNSYTELFACTGIIGMFLFIYIVALFISKQWEYYKKSKEPLFLYLFIFGVLWAGYNFLYAFYLSVWLMPFLYCIWGYSERMFATLK